MAAPILVAGTGSPQDFVDCSTLSYFIPLDTSFDPEALGPGAVTTNPEPFASVERRESLFFDESVQLSLVLKTTYNDEDSLPTALRGFAVTVEANVVNSNAQDRDGSTSSEVIFSGHLNGSESPKIIKCPAIDDTSKAFTCIVWSLPVFLTRPRIRLQKPMVVISANASFTPPETPLPDLSKDGYMISGAPSTLNLLGSIGTDPSLNGIQPRLSALRVSRVAPITQHAQDMVRSIKSLSKIRIPVQAVCHSRVRFSRPNATPTSTTIISILEVDFTPFFDCEITLDSISLTVDEGTVKNLTDQPDLSLPLSCVAHDHVVFLYRVAPEDDLTVAKNPTRSMDIAINATAVVEPGRCEPKLTMAWKATVDFTLPLNPGYGSTTQPMQRSHRPGQLSIGGDIMTSLTAPAVARPDSLPSLEASTTKVDKSIPELGITLTFTAPPTDEKIKVGEEFVWGVFVVNRSTNAANVRKLALIAIPRRRRNEARVTRPPSISRPFSSFSGQAKSPRDKSVADAVLDENVVHAMQRSSVVDSADVVCMSGDVRVGPLPAGACHSVELKFLALKAGIVSVEAIRVVDLVSNEHVDIRDLPTTMIESAAQI